MSGKVRLLALCVVLVAISRPTHAEEEYVQMMPNAERARRNGQSWEAVGHDVPDDGGPVNGFGADFSTIYGLDPWNTKCGRCGDLSLCQFDSDGDGQSNGEELGDPCCEWSIGQAPRFISDISHPSYGDSKTSRMKPVCTNVPIVRDNVAPKKALRKLPLWISIVIPVLVILVSVLLLHWLRTSAAVQIFSHKTLGPFFIPKHHSIFGFKLSFLGSWWFQTLDMLGLRDVIPETMRLTWAEFTVCFLFIFGLFLIFISHVITIGDRNTPAAIGLALGRVGESLFMWTVYPMQRTSIWLPLFGISFERAVKFHRWVGRAAFLAITGHLLLMFSAGYSLFWTTQYSKDTGPNLYGFLSWILFLVLLVTTIEPIRRKLFEVFYYSHLLALPILVLGALHSPDLWWMLIIPAALYGIDVLLRGYYGRVRRSTVVDQEHYSTSDGAQFTALELEVIGYHHRPGGFVWLNISGINSVTWHPFSVSYQTSPNRFMLHIKNFGTQEYSGKLALLAKSREVRGVHVDGPYGAPTLHLEDYQCCIFVGCGIGVTPMISLLQEAARKYKEGRARFRHLRFVWTTPTDEYIPPFQAILSGLSSCPVAKLDIYLTRQKEIPPGLQSIMVQDDGGTRTATSSTASTTPSTTQTSTSEAGSTWSDSSTADDGRGRNSDSSLEAGSYNKSSLEFHMGRPDLPNLFRETTNGLGVPSVAVYACGPAGSLAAAHNAAREVSSSSCQFYVHTETFEF